jgi:hypothetical protein
LPCCGPAGDDILCARQSVRLQHRNAGQSARCGIAARRGVQGGRGRLRAAAADDAHERDIHRIASGASGPSISEVVVEIYRVFPLDSTNPAPPGSPTRANSPSDAAYEARDTATDSLTVSFTLLNPSFTALNSVLYGINPAPNNLTGGEGPVSGAEGVVTATFIPAITLPEGHYFFVAQVALFSGDFYWLSGSRPIVSPGTPFASDQQAWIRNANLAPNWLRIGTDIIGGGSSFNLAFTLTGQDDRIFADSFGP